MSDENRLDILIAYASGEKVRDIAVRHGVSHTYPSLLARSCNVRRGASADECRRALDDQDQRKLDARQPEPEPSPARGPDDVMVAEIRRLAFKGVPRTSIAALLRCGNRDVAAALD